MISQNPWQPCPRSLTYNLINTLIERLRMRWSSQCHTQHERFSNAVNTSNRIAHTIDCQKTLTFAHFATRHHYQIKYGIFAEANTQQSSQKQLSSFNDSVSHIYLLSVLNFRMYMNLAPATIIKMIGYDMYVRVAINKLLLRSTCLAPTLDFWRVIHGVFYFIDIYLSYIVDYYWFFNSNDSRRSYYYHQRASSSVRSSFVLSYIFSFLAI